MSLPLLQTKFYIPAARPQLVPRPHLLTRLASNGLRPLTLLSAPAGFGKTTLVTEWLHSLQAGEPGGVKLQAVWLSLGEDDDEPTRFYTYLIRALQLGQAQLGATALALLAAPQPPPLKEILIQLLNELSGAPASLVLVLDDYHVITAPPIHEALIFLIDHLPPTLRLIITSRVDPPLPLARWRVRQQLTEIRADDLRFRRAEIAHLLHDTLPVPLSDSEVAKLEARTEGWIAGLHLTILSMQGRPDLADFIEHFTGSHAYIIDYLVEEVLQRQPAAVQQFLLQTSILTRLCAPLCDQLTGRSDSQGWLEQLQRANLFLIALDDERRWFRYHHLFAEVLQARLRHSAPDQLLGLHQRAADWYEAAGLVDEAMQHAWAAQDWPRAALLVETHSIPLLLRSEVIRINRWLQALPRPLIETRPQLALVAAWAYMASRQLDELAHMLDHVPALQRADLDQEIQSQLLILRACLALFQGDFGQTTRYAEQGLQLVPAHLPSLRTTALLLLGSALTHNHDWQNAEPLLRETIALGITSGNLYNAMLAYHIISRMQSARGELEQALTTLYSALEVAKQQEQALIPVVGVIYIALGALWREPERYAEAIDTLQRGEELTKACFQVDILLYGWQAQVELHRAQGNEAQAQAVLQGAAAWLAKVKLPPQLQQGVLHILHTLGTARPQPELPKPPQGPANRQPTAPNQPLIEPLSERELEILRLVNAGLSNSAIADRLIVTVGTVKKHLNNVFGKLGVGSRTQALVRARESGLLN